MRIYTVLFNFPGHMKNIKISITMTNGRKKKKQVKFATIAYQWQTEMKRFSKVTGPITWELFLFLHRLVAAVDFYALPQPLVFSNKTWDSFGGKKWGELKTVLWNVIHAHPRAGCGCHRLQWPPLTAEVNMLGATDNTHWPRGTDTLLDWNYIIINSH